MTATGMQNTNPTQLTCGRIDTPTGEMLCVTGGDGVLRALEWVDQEHRLRDHIGRYQGADSRISMGDPPETIVQALAAYFAGDLKAIDSLAVNPGGTAFQREAWAALRRIPAGETRSYAEQAAAIGRPAATRAVGTANGANPIPIVVPCHRVIGADGSLTGFGGGLERKRWLLAHEGANIAAAQPGLFG